MANRFLELGGGGTQVTVDDVVGLQTELDAKVAKAGDTMSGDLTLAATSTLTLAPRTEPTATTVQLYSNSAVNDNLTLKDGALSYPIAGEQLITVKKSIRFSATVSQTLYTDDNMEFLWDATNLQVQFKPLTYLSNYVDACILFVPGNANNTVKDQSGDILFANNSTYYFSDDGLIDTSFNMTSYGARAFMSVCPEASVSSVGPCYRLDLMGGSTSYMNLTIEKQTV